MTTTRFIPATTGDNAFTNAEYRDFLDGTRLVDWLPSLPHDPSRPEDILKVDPDDDGVGGDDAADALRHLVVPKPNSLRMVKRVGF